MFDLSADEEEPSSRNRVRVDLFLQIPCDSRSPTPQTEPQSWVHYIATSPEEPEEPQVTEAQSKDISPHPFGSSQHSEINNNSTGSELHYPEHINCVHGLVDGRGSGSRSRSEDRHKVTGKSLLTCLILFIT